MSPPDLLAIGALGGAVGEQADGDVATVRTLTDLDTFLIDGRKVDARLDGRVLDATVVRTMEGASSLELDVDDFDYAVLTSGLLEKTGRVGARSQKLADFDQAAWARFGDSRLSYEGWQTRLAGASMTYGATDRRITLTFEDEIATLMRRGTHLVKARRGSYGGSTDTRASFIHGLLVSAIRGDRRLTPGGDGLFKRFFSPEESVTQQVRKPDVDAYKKGISSKALLTVKGVAADQSQRRNMEIVLGEADEQRAGELATLALLAACITESQLRNLTYGDSSSVGILQLLDIHLAGSISTRGGRRDIPLVVRLFLTRGFSGNGGAIKIAAQHPDWTPAQVAQAVQGSATADGSNYAPYVNEARKILEAWGGVYKTQVIKRRREFIAGGRRDGQDHNYWDDAGELAREVRWRLFADLNVLYFVSDEWLFQNKPALTIDRSPSTLNVQAQIDVGRPVAEITVTGRARPFKTPPGATVEIADHGPLNGRWLLWESRTSLFTWQTGLTLRRPAPKLKEPAPEVAVRRRTETAALEAGSVRRRVVEAALKAYRLDQESDKYRYQQVRPMPASLFARGTLYIDCSAFAILCYKAAGAANPATGTSKYDGYGYTGPMIANGTRTTDPQPGDLAFYRSPEHVGVYIGDGQVVEFGGDPGPMKIATKYRPDFMGFYTYDLGDA